MEDSQIIDLYWARLEQAIQETDTKYGGYCRAIAHNILKSFEDSEEFVADTWLRAWNAMPPQRPSARPMISSIMPRTSHPLAMQWPWPRCVDPIQSSSARSKHTPTPEASCPT